MRRNETKRNETKRNETNLLCVSDAYDQISSCHHPRQFYWMRAHWIFVVVSVDDTGRKTIWKRSFSKKTIWKRSFSEKTIWKRSFSEKTIWKRSFSMKTIWKRSFSEKTVLTQNDDLGLLEEMSRCLMPKEKLVVPENKSHSPIGNDCVSSDKYVLINQISFRLEVFRLQQYRTFQ